jgi:hypothetical protein
MNKDCWTEEDEAAYDQIREHALAILKFIKEPDDAIEVNRWLAELEPYPRYLIRVAVVPF